MRRGCIREAGRPSGHAEEHLRPDAGAGFPAGGGSGRPGSRGCQDCRERGPPVGAVHYDRSIDTARADALFASVLQISDAPSAVQVKQAIDAATSTLGDLGCAARVAQEFGEHPETAVTRMRWARAEVAFAFGGSPSGTS